MLRAFLLLALLPASGFAASLAESARVQVGLDEIVIGRKLGAAVSRLDCKDSAVQHTVRKCALKPAALASAKAVGNAVAKLTLVQHFQGEAVNMSVQFADGLSFAFLLDRYKSAIGSEPKIEYWADDDHLYASYIWVDEGSEVELTDTIKGAKFPGGVTVYVSSLTRNRPLSPDDAR